MNGPMGKDVTYLVGYVSCTPHTCFDFAGYSLMAVAQYSRVLKRADELLTSHLSDDIVHSGTDGILR